MLFPASCFLLWHFLFSIIRSLLRFQRGCFAFYLREMEKQRWYSADRVGAPIYTHSQGNKQGFEFDLYPYTSPHAGWPDATKPVWGIESPEPNDPRNQNDGKRRLLPGLNARESSRHERDQARRILGLTVGTFWGMVVLLCTIMAGGIGAGVGVGLASRKNNC